MTVFLFISILLTIGVLVTVGLVMPKKDMIITSEVVIDRPKYEVFQYVKLLRNQEQYSKWIMSDPNIKMTYTGTDGTVGFIAAWQSKSKSGNGRQQIIKVEEGIAYEAELRFRDHHNTTHARTSVEAIADNKTKVITTLSSTPTFPMNVMSSMIKMMIQKDMNENAANLKRVLEAKA